MMILKELHKMNLNLLPNFEKIDIKVDTIEKNNNNKKKKLIVKIDDKVSELNIDNYIFERK